MKKKILPLSISLFVLAVLYGMKIFFSSYTTEGTSLTQQMISFNVRGNGKTNVSLGVGYQVGSGACCRGVSKESTVGFQGNPGDVLYNSETRKVITKITKDLQGKTIDLREY